MAGPWFIDRVTGLGTLLNAIAILAGGIIGRTAARNISRGNQTVIKVVLVLLTIFAGINMFWTSLKGSLGQVAGQVGIALLSLMLGNAVGKLLRIQHSLNRLGHYAQERFARAQADGQPPASEGFITCTLLFCVGPMAILGSIQDGLQGDYRLLAIKAGMDGMATIGFAAVFGWSVMLAVIPLVAYQGTLTLCARWLEPYLNEAMTHSLNGTGGLLVLCIPMVILGLKKVPLADYLPSLIIAPLLTRWWL